MSDKLWENRIPTAEPRDGADDASPFHSKNEPDAKEKSKQQLRWESLISPDFMEYPGFIYPVVDDSLPNILIVGDSLSIQYTPSVRERLAGKANVFRIPGNGGPVARCIDRFEDWIGYTQWDVIIFNFGLHDSKYEGWDMAGGVKYSSPEKYREQVNEFVARVVTTGAKLVWISTTPIPDGAITNDKGSSIVFNKIAEEIMNKNHIPIMDLYSIVLPKVDELLRPKDIHFSLKGAEVAGKEIGTYLEAFVKELH